MNKGSCYIYIGIKSVTMVLECLERNLHDVEPTLVKIDMLGTAWEASTLVRDGHQMS